MKTLPAMIACGPNNLLRDHFGIKWDTDSVGGGDGSFDWKLVQIVAWEGEHFHSSRAVPGAGELAWAVRAANTERDPDGGVSEPSCEALRSLRAPADWPMMLAELRETGRHAYLGD